MRFELVQFLAPSHAADVKPTAVLTVNPDSHLVHVVAGCARVRIGAVADVIGPDTVLSIPQMTPYVVTKLPGRELSMINFHYHLAVSSGAPLYHRLALPVLFMPDRLPLIHRQLKQWYQRWSTGDDADMVEITGRLCGLVSRYLRHFGQVRPGRHTDNEMDQLRYMLDSRIAQPYDARQYADRVQLSISQMNRRFRAAFGVSPKRYWQQARLAAVQDMLANTQTGIADIARRCGYEGPQNFSRWFRALTGLSPRAWRDHHHKTVL